MKPLFEAPAVWGKPWFERLYRVGIVVKGFDGIVEFVSGMAILLSPHLLHMALIGVSAEFGEHNARPFQFIAQYIGRVDTQLFHSGLFFLTLFLITHGAVKIALVYALIRRIVKAYPAALVTLVLFLLYQIYVLITSFSVLMVFFTLLDVAIIWLVWNEYLELKTKVQNVVK